MNSRLFDNPYDSTIVKNVIFDRIMPTLSSDGWKVLCAAIRQAWGWTEGESSVEHHESNWMSSDHLAAKTGIQAPETIERAITECLEAGYLIRRQMDEDVDSGESPYTFALNTEFEIGDLVSEPLTADRPEIEPVGDAPAVLSPEQESALEALMAFGHEMGTEPDQTHSQQAVTRNDADTVLNWIETSRAMTNLEPPARFETAVQRLLDKVPPLPLSMLAPEPAKETAAQEPEPPALDAGELWQATLETLKSQMKRSTFKWLKPTQAVTLADGVLTVSVPNKRTKEWMEEGQPATTIQQALDSVAGEAIELKFVVGS